MKTQSSDAGGRGRQHASRNRIARLMRLERLRARQRSKFASSPPTGPIAPHRLMDVTPNCYDNAHIESVWNSLKYELIYYHRFASKAQARSAIFDYIETFYNRRRLHSSIGYQSPLDFEAQLN